jgi:DNA ligase-associated metallophosphoesterase
MSGTGFPLTLAGVSLQLLPGRAVWWPAEQTLFVADLHWGKEATFRQRGGMPIPDITRHELDRLEQLLLQTDCRRLVLLGDLVHSTSGRSPVVSSQVEQWRRTIALRQPSLELLLVEGNHDQRSGALPEAWGLTRLAPPVQIGPLTCAHYPEEAGPGPGLAGHLHPRIDLRRGPDRLRLPCFWLRGEQLTLPAFAWFASHSAITREPGDRVFAIADDEVLELVPDRAERSPAGRGRARY